VSTGLRSRFERDGFVVLDAFVDPAACVELREHAMDLVGAFEPDDTCRSVFSTDEQTRTSDAYFLDSGDQVRYFFEPEAFDAQGHLRAPITDSINKIGHAQHDLDPVFGQFSRTEDLASVAEALGVGGHVLVQSMYIFKSARIGGEVNCHDDHTFLFTDPATCVGFWFAIDDATVDNGCLWAEPGGHRHPPRKRFRRSADGGTAFDVLDPDPYPSDGLVPLEAPRGTLVVLDGLLPHRSGPNRSDLPRHAYTLHAIDPRASYPADNWLQRPDLPLRGFRG